MNKIIKIFDSLAFNIVMTFLCGICAILDIIDGSFILAILMVACTIYWFAGIRRHLKFSEDSSND